MNIDSTMADVFIQIYNITDPGTQECLRLVFEGYALCMHGKPIDQETMTYMHVFKKYCDNVISNL